MRARAESRLQLAGHGYPRATVPNVAKEKPVPTEKTPKGLEVPIPKRGEFFSNLKKIAKAGKSSTTRSAQK